MQCGVVWCGAILLVVQCDYAILQAILVWFLRFVQFMQFGKHPYVWACVFLLSFFWLGERSFFSFFLCWSLSISSIFRLPSIPFTVNASSPFMYFCTLNRRFVTVVGRVFFREKKRSRLFNLAWKVVIITWLFASSISNTALLKHFTYSLRVSPSCCFTVRYEMGLLWRWPPMKWQTKESLSCLKFTIDVVGSLLNHSLAAPLMVARNDMQITSFGVC